MLKITEAALTAITSEVKDLMDEGKKPIIRLSMAVGWGGPSPRLTLEESALDGDEITEENGVLFVVNERDQMYFKNTKLDFVKTFFGGGRFQVLPA